MFMLKNERHFELVQKYPNFLLNTHINEFDPQTIQIKTTMKTHTFEMVTTWRKSINYLLIPANWLSMCLCLLVSVPFHLFPIFICSSLCYWLCPSLSSSYPLSVISIISLSSLFHLYHLYHLYPLSILSTFLREISILSLSSPSSLSLPISHQYPSIFLSL